MEAAILLSAGEEPKPRTRLDKVLTYFQAGFGLTLGPAFVALGLAMLFA